MVSRLATFFVSPFPVLQDSIPLTFETRKTATLPAVGMGNRDYPGDGGMGEE